MPNIGPMEIIVVLIIALVVFGPKSLPELGKSLGKGINEFKGSISGDHDRDTTRRRSSSRPRSPSPPAPWRRPPRSQRRRSEVKRCAA